MRKSFETSQETSDLLIANLLVLSFPGNSFTPLDLKSPDRFTVQKKKEKKLDKAGLPENS